MNGLDAVRTALIGDSGMTALVPAIRIGAGPLPQNVTLPALSLASISKNDRNLPNPGVKRFVSERVQVSIVARSYPELQTVLRAVRSAAADKFPTVSGIDHVTIHTDSAGPNTMDEDGRYFVGSQDFIVTYSETR